MAERQPREEALRRVHGTSALFAALQTRQFQSQLIARFHRPFKLDTFESGQYKDAAAVHPSPCLVRKDRSDLGHGLAYEHSGHHRAARKMSLKKRFVKGNILDPDDLLFPLDFDDAIHKQKGVAMGDIFKNFFDVQH
jgi:hypothetical protein